MPLAALSVAAVATLLCTSGAAATFADPRGDAGTAPDVTSVDVRVEDGALEVRVTVANMTTLAEGAELHLPIDADRSRGDQHGVDHVYTLHDAGSALRTRRWNGARLAEFSSTARAGLAGGVASFRVAVDELGSPDAIGLGVVGVRGADSDAAPGNGSWTFRLAPTRVTSVWARFAPRHPVAGRTFRLAGARATLSDGSVRTGAASCRARLEGRVLGGRRCRWRLPAGSRGARLAVAVTVRVPGVGSATRQVRFRVR